MLTGRAVGASRRRPRSVPWTPLGGSRSLSLARQMQRAQDVDRPTQVRGRSWSDSAEPYSNLSDASTVADAASPVDLAHASTHRFIG
eukprot:4652297-Prymnesium_polylepis.1